MLQPPAHAAKHLALLDAAAQEFNARGLAGASIGRIARAMGLTRAAVYYYVKDREDLAVQCYRRTCEIMAADLASARAAPGHGLDKLVAFLRIALDPARTPPAVLSELDYLDGKKHAFLVAAHARNVESLRAMVRGGIADGSIRECDDEIVAQTLIGTVTWIPISVTWVDATDPGYRARTVETLTDVIVNGEAADPDYVFEPRVSIAEFFAKSPSAFDRKGAADAKIEQLLMTASRMFNRRGIDGTSLDEITAELGATKGALYHYLENKTDLVVRCYKRSFALTERFADAAETHGRNGLERALIGLYLNTQAHASGLSPLTLMVGSSALPANARREITRRARALQRRFEAFGTEGLKQGVFRDFDFDTMAQLGAGPFEWLPKWFPADDPRAHGALAREIVTLFIKGLRAR
jgi:AcrR family transcriptional regulator